jgi:hypothetical protein
MTPIANSGFIGSELHPPHLVQRNGTNPRARAA